MYLRWVRQQLKSNRQSGEVLCPHLEIERPWTVYPHIVHREDNRHVSIWSPGPTIRECCIERGRGLALAAWWWEVTNRFKDLNAIGLENREITAALLEQLPLIEGMLEDMVPKPTLEEWDNYQAYREEVGTTKRRIKTPKCLKHLGLTLPCSKEMLAERWKEIALKNHPDHGGNATVFHEYVTSYKAAKNILERRSA